MDVYLAAFLFCAALGALLFLYVLHFRNRALRLGPEGLRTALSRVLTAEEPRTCEDEELREGALELVARFRRCIFIIFILLLIGFACCLLLTALSALPGFTLFLCGLCLLLLSFLLSLLLLRDLALLILSDLQEAAKKQPCD